MAIVFNGIRAFSTNNTLRMGSNKAQFSQCFKLRVLSAQPPIIPINTNILSRNIFDFTHTFLFSNTSTALFRPKLVGSSTATIDIPLTIGSVYVFCLVWDGTNAVQTSYVNGVPTVMGRIAGNTSNRVDPIQIGPIVLGSPGITTTNIVYELGDVCSWDNVVLTLAQAQYLTNNGDPTTISGVGPVRWTLDGPVGATPTIGDAALKNTYGGSTDGSDFATVTGGGTAVYTAPLVWAPAVTANMYAASSGKIIAGTLLSDFDGSQQVLTQPITTPVLTVNGVVKGPLEKPWFTGYHKCVFFSTPGNYQILPTDTVSLTAPTAWCNTPAGAVAALSGPIDNNTGKSSVGSDIVANRTIHMGLNNCLAPTSSTLGFYYPLKNFKYRTDAGNGAANKVVLNSTLRVAVSSGNSTLGDGNGAPPAGVTLGYPGAIGKWLVVWDATNAVNPIVITMTTAQPSLTAVTQRSDLSSNGTVVGGVRVGMCRVADFQHVSPTGEASINVCVTFNDPARDGNPHYNNLWIFAPGDWSEVGGVAVYDRSDPLALSATYLDRVGDPGSMRFVDSSACGGDPHSFANPEKLNSVNDECWGTNSARGDFFRFTRVDPVDTAVTPWIYSPIFGKPGATGESFTATLASNITTAPPFGTNEVYTFTDAATAPLMEGLEIKIGNEVCRILDVTGTAVTLYRGSNGTTPATHTAGTVTVYGRKNIFNVLSSAGTLGGNLVWQMTSQTPHGMMSGQNFNLAGWTGPAGSGGVLHWSDGTNKNPVNIVREGWVTGPNTVFTKVGLATSGAPVLTNGGALDPATNFSQISYGIYLPYEVIANICGRFPHANLHINTTVDACDDMVWTVARIIRDNFPAGRKVYVEAWNEPWNFFFPNVFNYATVVGPVLAPSWPVLYQGAPNNQAYYIYRALQVHQIFRSVFTAAGRDGEIVGLVNMNMNADPNPYLDVSITQGIPIDAVAVAPYLFMENTPLNVTTFNSYDDEQAIDMWTHELFYGRVYNPPMVDKVAKIEAYNKTTGNHCILMGYEGGFETMAPGGIASTAVSWNERNHDIFYNPNWYIAEQDWYYWLQLMGFDHLHIYSLAQYWNPHGWGIYHGLFQPHGRGDGSDGKANNLLYRANHAAANYKGTQVNQDDRCVSVRGEAYLRWNASLAGVTPPPIVVPPPGMGNTQWLGAWFGRGFAIGRAT